jgi:hypothetical protein
MIRYEYLCFPADSVCSLFAARAREKREGYVADCLLSQAIDQALRDGFRWVRTDFELAIFEREAPEQGHREQAAARRTKWKR